MGQSSMSAATGFGQEALTSPKTNHVFPRPCPDPSAVELTAAVETLMRGESGADEIGALTTIMYACHGDSVAAGWHHDIATGQPKHRDRGEMFMLAISELAEAMEGDRKNRMDDKLPHRKMIEVELADFMIRCGDMLALPEFGDALVKVLRRPRDRISDVSMNENVGRLLAHITTRVTHALIWHESRNYIMSGFCIVDAMRYAADLAGLRNLDLAGAVCEKRTFNRTRKDHSVQARLTDGGKTY